MMGSSVVVNTSMETNDICMSEKPRNILENDQGKVFYDDNRDKTDKFSGKKSLSGGKVNEGKKLCEKIEGGNLSFKKRQMSFDKKKANGEFKSCSKEQEQDMRSHPLLEHTNKHEKSGYALSSRKKKKRNSFILKHKLSHENNDKNIKKNKRHSDKDSSNESQIVSFVVSEDSDEFYGSNEDETSSLSQSLSYHTSNSRHNCLCSKTQPRQFNLTDKKSLKRNHIPSPLNISNGSKFNNSGRLIQSAPIRQSPHRITKSFKSSSSILNYGDKLQDFFIRNRHVHPPFTGFVSDAQYPNLLYSNSHYSPCNKDVSYLIMRKRYHPFPNSQLIHKYLIPHSHKNQFSSQAFENQNNIAFSPSPYNPLVHKEKKHSFYNSVDKALINSKIQDLKTVEKKKSSVIDVYYGDIMDLSKPKIHHYNNFPSLQFRKHVYPNQNSLLINDPNENLKYISCIKQHDYLNKSFHPKNHPSNCTYNLSHRPHFGTNNLCSPYCVGNYPPEHSMSSKFYEKQTTKSFSSYKKLIQKQLKKELNELNTLKNGEIYGSIHLMDQSVFDFKIFNSKKSQSLKKEKSDRSLDEKKLNNSCDNFSNTEKKNSVPNCAHSTDFSSTNEDKSSLSSDLDLDSEESNNDIKKGVDKHIHNSLSEDKLLWLEKEKEKFLKICETSWNEFINRKLSLLF